MRKVTIFLLILLFVIIYESLYSSITRYFNSTKLFNKAKNIAKRKNKKLLVIGDPCIGNVIFNKLQKAIPNYQHGDVTIDLYGCSKCEKVDINDEYILNMYENNNYVVFETGTLSFSKNIEKTIKEIKRISGGDFFSSGGTYSYYWEYIGSKIYSLKYPDTLKYMIYPFDSTKDRIYKAKKLFDDRDYVYLKFNAI